MASDTANRPIVSAFAKVPDFAKGFVRDLRATEARRHVREEVPFHTGRRIELAELGEVLA